MGQFENRGVLSIDQVGPDYFHPYSGSVSSDTAGTASNYVSGQCERSGSGSGFASQTSYIVDDSASQTVTINFQGTARGTGSCSVTWDGVSDCYTIAGGGGTSRLRVEFDLTEAAEAHVVANASFGEFSGVEITLGVPMGAVVYQTEVGD